MKKFIAIFLFFYSVSLYGQNKIDLIKNHTNAFPEISVDLYLFDESGNVLSAIPHTDFVIRDNGQILNTTEFSCPEQNVINPSSIILSLDLALKNDQLRDNFEVGINLANELLYSIDNEATEVALTSFDNLNYLLGDFTYNVDKLDLELQNQQNVNTSFIEAAFIDKPAGAFILADENNTKEMIIITDNKSSFESEIIANGLNQREMSLHCLFLGGDIPSDLKELVENSGGFWRDNISDESDIQLEVNALLKRMQGFKPCTLKWSGEITCNDEHFIQLSVPSLSVNTNFTYLFEANDKPYVEVIPEPYLGFSSVELGTSETQDITIVARNSDINVQEFLIENNRFQIVAGDQKDFTLPKDSFHNLSIQFTPTDSAIVFTELIIRSNACEGESIPITGGYPNTPPVTKTIDLLTPECDETLIVGQQEKIEWIGLLPTDVVHLEFSSDNGAKWDTLAINYTGLSLDWTVPDIVSEDCLIKITQLWPNNVGKPITLHHANEVNSAFFNKDGSKVITSGADSTVIVWNSNTGEQITTFDGHFKEVNYAVFSPNNRHAVSASDDRLAMVWDVENGEKIAELKEHNNRVMSANYSHDGQLIATAGKDGKTILWRTSDYTIYRILESNPSGTTEYAEFSPDDSRLVTCGKSDGLVKIWDWQNGEIEKVFDTKGESDVIGHVIHATYNYDGTKIAASNTISEKVSVWDVAAEDTLYCVTHSVDTLSQIYINSSSFYFNPNVGEILLTSGISDNTIKWWDGETGEPIFPFNLNEHSNGVTTAVFNFDASRVLTASWDSTAKILNRDQNFLQIDTTDCPFSIAYAEASAKDIEFGEVIVNHYKDSIISDFIINDSKFGFDILDVQIFEGDLNDFMILNDEYSPFKLDSAETASIELRFSPTDVGDRYASIRVIVPGDTLVYVLKGIGINEGLIANADIIEFGEVELGDLKQLAFDRIVTNRSNSDIGIDSIYITGTHKEEFALLSGHDFVNVPSDQSLTASIRFIPSTIGKKNAQLVYEHKSQSSPTKINLFGTGIENVLDSLTISIGNAQGEPGDIIELPLQIENASPEALVDYDGLITTIRFNATILEPLDFESVSDEIVNNERIMKLDLPFSRIQGNTLMTLKFRIALGNDSTTVITPEFTELKGNNKIKIYEKEGRISVNGLCEEGGLRLFHTEGELLLEQNAPNPAKNSTNVNFEVIENGITMLFITDINGTVVKDILSSELEIGAYSYSIDITELPQGIYYYILQTPTQRLTKKMIITK